MEETENARIVRERAERKRLYALHDIYHLRYNPAGKKKECLTCGAILLKEEGFYHYHTTPKGYKQYRAHCKDCMKLSCRQRVKIWLQRQLTLDPEYYKKKSQRRKENHPNYNDIDTFYRRKSKEKLERESRKKVEEKLYILKRKEEQKRLFLSSKVLPYLENLYEIPEGTILNKDHNPLLIEARRIASFIFINDLDVGPSEVARLLHQDHSTILHHKDLLKKKIAQEEGQSLTYGENWGLTQIRLYLEKEREILKKEKIQGPQYASI